MDALGLRVTQQQLVVGGFGFNEDRVRIVGLPLWPQYRGGSYSS